MISSHNAIKNISLITVLFVSATFSGCSPRVWLEEKRSLELSSANIQRLTAESHNGDIKVYAVEDAAASIKVEAHLRAGGLSEADARDCLQALTIDTTVIGDEQQLRAKYLPLRKAHWQAQVSFHVLLPREMNLAAESHNGDIFVTGVQGLLVLHSHNGDVTVHDGTGEIQATTHNGDIEAITTTPKIELITHNGRVHAKLGSTTTLTGKITSHNGSIELQLAPEVSALLNCRTANGAIDLVRTVEVVSKKRNELQAKLGGGDALLEVDTHNGSISIR